MFTLDDPWRKRDLEWCADNLEDYVRRLNITTMLMSVVWLALVENDTNTSTSCLHQLDRKIEKIETLTAGEKLTSYQAFKQTLTNAVVKFTVETKPSHRLQALLDAYPATFPLHKEILAVCRDLDDLRSINSADPPRYKAIMAAESPFTEYEPLSPLRHIRQLMKTSELSLTNAIAVDPNPKLSAREAAACHLSPTGTVLVAFCDGSLPETAMFNVFSGERKTTFTTGEKIAYGILNQRTEAFHVTITVTSHQGYRRCDPFLLRPGGPLLYNYQPGELAPGDYVCEVREKGKLLGSATAKVLASPKPTP